MAEVMKHTAEIDSNSTAALHIFFFMVHPKWWFGGDLKDRPVPTPAMCWRPQLGLPRAPHVFRHLQGWDTTDLGSAGASQPLSKGFPPQV